MRKMQNRIVELVNSASVKFVNGHQIKTVSFGNWDMKPFQVNKIKYKFGVEISEKCNNQTQFIPTKYEFKLVDYRTGSVYSKIEDIAEFLLLKTEEVQELLLPMVKKSKFTEKEINKSIQEYREFILGFRKDFVGIEDSERTVEYIKTTDIRNLL